MRYCLHGFSMLLLEAIFIVSSSPMLPVPSDSISPVDSRYKKHVEELKHFFTDAALNRYRIKIEIEYFIALCELPLPQLKNFPREKFEELRSESGKKYFDEDVPGKLYQIERTTNHDVKAVEYFLKSKMENMKLKKYGEFVHFGLTSQDINNTAVPMLWRDGLQQVYHPLLHKLSEKLSSLADEWKNVSMLAHTHGQPASPTRLGKEIKVFIERLQAQSDQIKTIPFSAKFGGATGNFNAHYAAYPHIDWKKFADDFAEKKLGLKRSKTTTQIEHYDNLASQFHALTRINTILIDLCRDIWLYISMEYFKQKVKEGEIGSSTMPHKVNPIDFENAEGNLGIANALFIHFAEKLPISRLQRDLSDSTVLRNIGVPLAHTVIAMKSILKGLDKLLLNEKAMNDDLEKNWAVVSEGIQTILRREGVEGAYEKLKEFTRGKNSLAKNDIIDFILQLPVSQQVKDELLKITPQNYTGAD